jgi:hypothetical protein
MTLVTATYWVLTVSFSPLPYWGATIAETQQFATQAACEAEIVQEVALRNLEKPPLSSRMVYSCGLAKVAQ